MPAISAFSFLGIPIWGTIQTKQTLLFHFKFASTWWCKRSVIQILKLPWEITNSTNGICEILRVPIFTSFCAKSRWQKLHKKLELISLRRYKSFFIFCYNSTATTLTETDLTVDLNKVFLFLIKPLRIFWYK